ncbi:prevent-host-death protein [Devosia sp. Root436]|uniref:type II toxin-antitoxin system Phd/YefM family antitoxin n=1 Tax=Devosia sp. Root436 TaxID=1736537 RepID=UPI0006FE6DAE|nr:type II toxin-antitoxin system prevent-host-death family antitoxin [Devosia sp. Root436]KQX38937.1 prevent-host-death protein [Devosia sp. Root436]
MDVSVSDAKAQLTDLVRRAEEGEEIVLTRHGTPIARIAPVKKHLTPSQRRAILDEVRGTGTASYGDGTDAAHSQDFLYDEDGLPG